MDGNALTTWLLVQLAFDSCRSMNEGTHQSQDNIGFRKLCNQKENEDDFVLFLLAVVDNVPISAACRNGFGAVLSRTFFGSFVDLEARPNRRSLLDLMFDPAGMRPFVEEWEKVAASLLKRLRREAVGQVVDAE